MLQLLNKNIMEYILNPYLDYLNDINKLKQLFEHKLNIKPHFKIENTFYNKTEFMKYKIINLDNKLIRIIKLYKHKEIPKIKNYDFNMCGGLYQDQYVTCISLINVTTYKICGKYAYSLINVDFDGNVIYSSIHFDSR